MKVATRLLATVAVLVSSTVAPSSAAASGGLEAIDATGATDVTKALQAYLAGLPDGSTVDLPAGATYRIDGTIVLRDRRGLVVDGHGSTIKAVGEGDRDRSQVRLRGGSDLTFRHLVVQGANPAGGTGEGAYRSSKEAQHGFEALGVDGLTLEDVTVTDVFGDFVYLGAGEDRWTSAVRISGSTFARNGRQGVAITAARDVVVERSSFTDTRRATFDIEPNTAAGGAVDVTIEDNTVGAGRLLFVAAHGARGEVHGITISGNQLHRPLSISIVPPTGSRRSDITIEGNTSDADSDGAGGGGLIAATRVDRLLVRRNTLRATAGRGLAVVALKDSCAPDVGDNDVPGAVAQFRELEPCAAAPLAPGATAPARHRASRLPWALAGAGLAVALAVAVLVVNRSRRRRTQDD